MGVAGHSRVPSAASSTASRATGTSACGPTRRSTWRRSSQPVDRLDTAPARVLDLGTGTGAAALWLARRYPEARVTGVDISEPMIEKARAKLPGELAERVDFRVADAERLPFADGAFDLVAQISVPVFFDEVARVLAPGGHVVVVSSLGVKTPFHTPEATVRKRFAEAWG